MQIRYIVAGILLVNFNSFPISASIYREISSRAQYLAQGDLEFRNGHLFNRSTGEQYINEHLESSCVLMIKKWYKFIAKELVDAINRQDLADAEKIRGKTFFANMKPNLDTVTLDLTTIIDPVISQRFSFLISAGSSNNNYWEYALILLLGYENLIPTTDDIKILIQALSKKGYILQNGVLYKDNQYYLIPSEHRDKWLFSIGKYASKRKELAENQK